MTVIYSNRAGVRIYMKRTRSKNKIFIILEFKTSSLKILIYILVCTRIIMFFNLWTNITNICNVYITY